MYTHVGYTIYSAITILLYTNRQPANYAVCRYMAARIYLTGTLSGVPGVPGAPGVPSAPDAPSSPYTPDAPCVSSAPGAPLAPGISDAPGVPSRPYAPGVSSALMPLIPLMPPVSLVPLVSWYIFRVFLNWRANLRLPAVRQS